MKIIELRAENIKGIKAIEISPTTDFVELAGKNGQGKSSILDAIWLALGGRDANKDVTTPLRNGATNGKIVLDLGTLHVERRYTDKGTTSLKVTRVDDGVTSTVGSPQTALDALRAITLDPAGFIALTPVQQREQLLGLLDLDVDLDALAAARKTAYDDRADVGRESKSWGDTPPISDDLPTEETSAADLIDKISEGEDQMRRRVTVVEERNRLAQLLDDAHQAVVDAKNALERADAGVKAAPPPVDVGPLREQLETVEETNAAIRANNQARDHATRKTELRTNYETLTAKIDDLDQQRTTAINKAKVPVEGLDINETGLTLDGVPFSDVNPGHQVRAALRIIAALKPKLRIIQVRQGALIDEDGRTEIKAFASEHDYQIWFETVGNGGPDAIVIENGEVAP